MALDAWLRFFFFILKNGVYADVVAGNARPPARGLPRFLLAYFPAPLFSSACTYRYKLHKNTLYSHACTDFRISKHRYGSVKLGGSGIKKKNFFHSTTP